MRGKILEMVREYTKENPMQITGVPVAGRVYGADEVANLVEAALDFTLTADEWNAAFEKKLSIYLGVRYALTCNSGSSANLLAVSALLSPVLGASALKPGDEVITCATGFPTTVNPIIMNGLVPVFLDCEIPTYNIDCEYLEAALTERTRAIMVAHTLGNPFNIPAIKQFAERHNLFLIEDCCDALGSTYDGKHVGTFGDIGTLSFYPAHHITTGEGGAVFTNSSRLKRAMESIRDWGRDCWCEPGRDNTCNKRYGWTRMGELPPGYDHKYTYSNLGYNLKMTDLQAAIGCAQMDKLPKFVAARRKNFQHMYDAMEELKEFFILPKWDKESDPSWFGFPLTCFQRFQRDDLLRHLNDSEIGTRLLFGGNLTKQPYMQGKNFRQIGDLWDSDAVMKHTFWTGVYPALSSLHMEYVFEKIRYYVKKS